MRRLATQSRGGEVRSARDYQEIVELGNPIEFVPIAAGQPSSVTLRYGGEARKGDLVAFGGYIASAHDVQLSMTVSDETQTSLAYEASIEAHRYWTRIGKSWVQNQPSGTWKLTLQWNGGSSLLVWGLALSPLRLPDNVVRFIEGNAEGFEYLNSRHLAPESFYLPCDAPIVNGTIEGQTNVTVTPNQRLNPGKKCSQCQRHLPIDPRLEGHRAATTDARRSPPDMVLAFHGHKSKRTGYQNECRACKKFEINDHFNELRTPDQLHESSVLTRERKLLLRENQALQEFKERVSKEGLRHHIWSLFGKKCFKCGVAVELNTFELDHTRPLVYLWPLDRYATCLCSVCNNSKKDSFPVEFYTEEELQRLSAIVGLPLEELRKRSINQVELQRIRSDIVTFASTWSPRLFNSVAVRVAELEPQVVLFAELSAAYPELYAAIDTALKMRPSPVLGEDEMEDLDVDDTEEDDTEDLDVAEE